MFRKLSAPITVNWEITNLCNLNCIHCYNYWKKDKSIINYMEDNFYRVITEEIIKNKVFNVIITGGEPLLVIEKIFPFLNKLVKNGVKLLLNSNLTLFNKRIIEKLQILGINSILTSLPSSKIEIYKLITGNMEAFLKVIKGIELALKNKININVNMVITKINLKDIFSTAKYLSQLGVTHFSATKAAIPASGIDFSKYSLSIIDFRYMLDELLRIKTDLKMKVSSLEFYPICAYGNEVRLKTFGTKFCTAGKTACAISFNGDIFPCPHLYLKNYGNINTGLKNAWDSMDMFRKDYYIPEQCHNCNFKNFCMGGCKAEALLKNNYLNSPDPYSDFTIKPFYSKNKKIVRQQLNANEKLLIDKYLKTREESFGGVLFSSLNNWAAVDKKVYKLIKNNIGHLISTNEFSKYLNISLKESDKTINFLISKSILLKTQGRQQND